MQHLLHPFTENGCCAYDYFLFFGYNSIFCRYIACERCKNKLELRAKMRGHSLKKRL